MSSFLSSRTECFFLKEMGEGVLKGSIMGEGEEQ